LTVLGLICGLRGSLLRNDLSGPLPDLKGVFFFDMETEGLNPHKHRIITIQVRHRGSTEVWKEWQLGEAGCLDSLFVFLDRADWNACSLVGYNVLRFDIPFVDVRLRALGLMNERAWHLLHTWPHVIDLYQLLGDYYLKARQWYSSVTPVANAVTNSDVPGLYARRQYGAIEGYVEREMEAMEFLFEDVKQERFYSELVKLREIAVKE